MAPQDVAEVAGVRTSEGMYAIICATRDAVGFFVTEKSLVKMASPHAREVFGKYTSARQSAS